MNDLLQLFKKNVEEEELFHPGDLLLLAVSGGVDSVVLCELCHLSGFRFVIAHCNFQLRGEESERDEHFVEGLAEHYGREIFLKRFNTEACALQNKTSIQVAARVLRYQWFDELAITLKAEKNIPVHILTAHHADDNIETVLMNFFKGTGVAGMSGMQSRVGEIVRPLLFAGKQDLTTFAKQRQLTFVEDSSNDSDKYSRNYLRHRVLPVIQEIYPSVRENIIANIDRFREIELLYVQSITVHKKKLLEERGSEVFIPVLKLSKVIPLKTVFFEIIKAYGFTAKQTKDVVALLYAETGKFILSSTHRILRHRNWLVISPLQPIGAQMVLIREGEAEVVFKGGKLCITIRDVSSENPELPASAAIACLDLKLIEFPLILRKWKAGDYFYPLGMQKKKKLSRFFIDRKMSLSEKENTWVIEMNKKIIWVVNKRIDDRFKVLPGTRTMLKIALKAAEV
jgi:tRNA(Ile)-lysidine synthase